MTTSRRPSPVDPAAAAGSNFDATTVASFGEEWARFDQSGVSQSELAEIFEQYFHAFPWHALPPSAEGFDMGCGSGRWAKFVAPRVGLLNCVDASPEALDVARRTLAEVSNVRFHNATANTAPLAKSSQDFGYSLGVLHHIPDTAGALRGCVQLLKPGAPMLVYLYYRFDNRPAWFRYLWRASELMRSIICRLPARMKFAVTDVLAAVVYWPLARLSWLGEKLGLDTRNFPLYAYRNQSFYTMRTDSRDRFGTPLEQRFTREEIRAMMEAAGLVRVEIPDRVPYWCAVGFRSF